MKSETDGIDLAGKNKKKATLKQRNPLIYLEAATRFELVNSGFAVVSVCFVSSVPAVQPSIYQD